MEGHAKSVFSLFVENKCFIVPIYQRPYSWKIEQCRQMFSDILACASGKRESHLVMELSLLMVNRGLLQFHYCCWR